MSVSLLPDQSPVSFRPLPHGETINLASTDVQVEADAVIKAITEENQMLTLDMLPSELLLLIFSYIDAPHLINTVSRVCQKFNVLLLSAAYWKTRLATWYHPCKYPPVSVVSDFDWMSACFATEQTYSLWRDEGAQMEHISITNAQFGTIDTVHLLKDGQFLASGSRDRCLAIFDLSQLKAQDTKSYQDAIVFSDNKSHQGWIWCLSSNADQFCSGCWDSKIRLWDMAANNSLVTTFRCKSAILDIHMDQDEIIAGGHDKCLYNIDRRDMNIRQVKLHQRPILCLTVTARHIITGSEDRQICVYDRTANTVFKKISLENYPMCMSYANNQLWVGNRVGHVYLLDCSDDKFEIVQSYDFGHKRILTGIKHSTGALFTSSSDQCVRVMEPTASPREIACLSPNREEIYCLDFCNNILSCAGSNNVNVWRPKPEL